MSEAHPDLVCRRVADVVTEYLEAQLEAAERAHLEQHLLICQACVDFVAQNKFTIAGLRALGQQSQPLPAAARDSVMAAFRTLRKDKP